MVAVRLCTLIADYYLAIVIESIDFGWVVSHGNRAANNSGTRFRDRGWVRESGGVSEPRIRVGGVGVVVAWVRTGYPYTEAITH